MRLPAVGQADNQHRRDFFGRFANALFNIWNSVVLVAGILAVTLLALAPLASVDGDILAAFHELTFLGPSYYFLAGLILLSVVACWVVVAVPLGILAYVTRPEYDAATVAALEEQNRLLREIVARGQPISAAVSVPPGGGTKYGRSYRVQSDGSVEARRPDGIIEHFHSMDEFEARCR